MNSWLSQIEFWGFVILFGGLALWWLANTIFSAYFKAKEEYVERLVQKQKGLDNGNQE